MVTRIHKHGPRRFYLREHRKAKDVSAETMAGRLGIERESVYRLERHPLNIDFKKLAAYAAALQLEPEDLWRPPGTPSLDGMVADAPAEVREMAVDIVRRLVTGGRS